MKEGPDIAFLGSLMGDPARANMLTALMSGKALTATELAAEAGITAQTASTHLSKLRTAGLVHLRKQGRHRYFSLSDDDVGGVLELMMGLAAKRGHMRTQPGPKDPALRKARVCYDHLAGEFGVRMFDSLITRGFLSGEDEHLGITDDGHRFLTDFGIDLTRLGELKRPLCKSCLDWSARRTHLAGSLGKAILNRLYELRWARRLEASRAIEFSRNGESQFLKQFCLHD